MKLVLYLYSAALLAGLSTASIKETLSAESIDSVALQQAEAPLIQQNINMGAMSTILQDILHIDVTNSTEEQQKMLDRIQSQAEQDLCLAGEKMLCLVDSLLRNISRDLVTEGITDFSKQIDIKKLDALLARLFSTLDKDLLNTYFPIDATTINSVMMDSGDYDLWAENGPEFQSYLKLAVELDSLLINHDKFLLSDIITPFVLEDFPLKEKAIQSLIESPSFQLKPLDPKGRFYDIMTRIKQHQLNNQSSTTDIVPPSQNSTTIFIPMDSIMHYNFAEILPLPELNSTDIANATAIIDQSNGSLIDFISSTDKGEELILMNAILRSLLGDLLGMILDLPGKLLGTGGKGSNNGGGLTITIGIGGGSENSNDDDDRRKAVPTPTPVNSKKRPTRYHH